MASREESSLYRAQCQFPDDRCRPRLATFQHLDAAEGRGGGPALPVSRQYVARLDRHRSGHGQVPRSVLERLPKLKCGCRSSFFSGFWPLPKNVSSSRLARSPSAHTAPALWPVTTFTFRGKALGTPK